MITIIFTIIQNFEVTIIIYTRVNPYYLVIKFKECINRLSYLRWQSHIGSHPRSVTRIKMLVISFAQAAVVMDVAPGWKLTV